MVTKYRVHFLHSLNGRKWAVSRTVNAASVDEAIGKIEVDNGTVKVTDVWKLVRTRRVIADTVSDELRSYE